MRRCDAAGPFYCISFIPGIYSTGKEQLTSKAAPEERIDENKPCVERMVLWEIDSSRYLLRISFSI